MSPAASGRVFAALGDETRLALIEKLSMGQPCSISNLAAGSAVTRQAVTKHLGVLERAGLVSAIRVGRESRYALNPQPLNDAEEYLRFVSTHWENALGRLKAFVESEQP